MGECEVHIGKCKPPQVARPPVAATIRVAVQLLFIWAGIALWRRSR
ncbi:MAG: hypothetical protein ACOVO5_04260 [Devosia sp.]